MALPNDDQVRFDILIEAKAAMNSLREFLKITDDNSRKVVIFSEVVMRQSKLMGVHWTQLLGVYKQLNAEMSKSHKATLFGNVGGKDLFGDASQLMQGWEKAGRTFDNVGQSAKRMGDEVDGASKKSVRGLDLVRIALGAIVAMILFNVIQAVQTFFKGAIDQATQFEATLYRIANAERQLSLEGVEVSIKGLKDGINDLKKAFPIFSKEDLAELVGGIATTTKELGFGEEQILKMAAAVAVLNINSTESETLLQTMGKVVNSVISPQAKSVGNLGLAFGKANIEAKALDMQLLKTGETFEDLTEEEKTQVKYQIVLDTAGIGDVQDLDELLEKMKEMGLEGTDAFKALQEYLESNSAKLQENAAAWKDLQTTVGQIIIPMLPALSGFFELINSGLQAGKVLLIEFVVRLGMAVAAVQALKKSMAGEGNFTEIFKESVEELRVGLVNSFFKEIPEDAPDWFMRGWGKHIKEQAETATGPLKDLGEALEEVDFSEFEEKIQDILEDAANAKDDLDKKLDQKKEDLDLEYLRKAEDAEKDYLRKIEDINRDAERDLQNLKDKHREEDIRAEQDYQNKLWELRMRYLMNLEDALHARDARQVIRLMKEYAIDKEALERKKNLEDKQREEDQKDEIAEIEQRRQERIEDARIEYEQKLADQRLAKQRELDDLNVWYERELADLEQSIQRKMEALIDGWIEEQKLTEANAAQVYGILYKYFGPGGMTDALYAYMRQQFSQPIPIPLPGGMPAPYWELAAGSTPPSTGVKDGREMSTSGAMLAARPTSSIFGTGSNINSPLPLNRIGRDTGKFSGSGAGSTNMDGLIRMELMLSPDLEARVIENTMNNVAEVIVKVTDSK